MAALPHTCEQVNKSRQDGLSIMICRAQRKDWVLQNAVEGTHRDLVHAVLTRNH